MQSMLLRVATLVTLVTLVVTTLVTTLVTLVTQGVHNDFHLPVMESIKRTTNQLAITYRAINSLVSTD